MPTPVVATGSYLPVVPILRSIVNLAAPPELSTQFSVNRASRVVPEAPGVTASAPAPIAFQTVRLARARNIDGGSSVAAPGLSGGSALILLAIRAGHYPPRCEAPTAPWSPQWRSCRPKRWP